MIEEGPQEEFVGSDEEPEEDDECEASEAAQDAETVRLRPSRASFLPATVFVDYPAELRRTRDDVFVTQQLGSLKLGYKSHWERICVRNAFKRAGFAKKSKCWTAMWSKHPSQSQLDGMNCLQKVNHFPASWCIGRKDRLHRTLKAMRRQHGSEFDFHPDTFVMPFDHEALKRAIKTDSVRKASEKARKQLWIVKPCASSCGRGISVVTSSQAIELSRKKKIIVQRYMSNPLLINGKKFDLRVYVLVTGVDPLRVFIHEEGLVRLSTADYSTQNIRNKFAHLTNFSINKKSDAFKSAEARNSDNTDFETDGFKWSLRAFRKWLADQVGTERTNEVFAKIDDICLKTIIAAEAEITSNLCRSAPFRTNCFELFGCDIILDSDLQPHLLEVNISPSLMSSTPLDKYIKGVLIADVLHTVGLYAHDVSQLEKFGNSKRSSTNPTADGSAESIGGNPFTFCNWTELLAQQDEYRRNPHSSSIDLNRLKQSDAHKNSDSCSWWQLLLMIEDEIARSKSGGLRLLYPVLPGASRYARLFHIPRFSDQLLVKWIGVGGCAGGGYQFLPDTVQQFLPRTRSRCSKPSTPKVTQNSNNRFSCATSPAHAILMTPATEGLDYANLHRSNSRSGKNDRWETFNRINRNIWHQMELPKSPEAVEYTEPPHALDT